MIKSAINLVFVCCCAVRPFSESGARLMIEKAAILAGSPLPRSTLEPLQAAILEQVRASEDELLQKIPDIFAVVCEGE